MTEKEPYDIHREWPEIEAYLNDSIDWEAFGAFLGDDDEPERPAPAENPFVVFLDAYRAAGNDMNKMSFDALAKFRHLLCDMNMHVNNVYCDRLIDAKDIVQPDLYPDFDQEIERHRGGKANR